MPWGFRKSFSPLPGVRINLSPSGLSTSVGVGPLRLYSGSRGTALTTRIPGTGVSFRQPLKPGATTPAEFQTRAAGDWSTPQSAPTSAANGPQGEISSAGTSVLTSEGLIHFKELLTKAQDERRSLLPELQAAANESARLSNKYAAWKNGWLLRRILRRRFEQLQNEAEEWQARHEELQEQEKLSRLPTEFNIPDSVRKAFSRLSDSFVEMSGSERVWDTISMVATDRSRERTTASNSISRRQVSFGLGECDLIESELRVPHLANANGGDLFMYPGFILFYISTEAFALLEAAQVDIEFQLSPFIEEEAIPSDTRVVRQTWKKANKDGSPDKRFANNYQIPVVEYGGLSIKSPNGLNEHYMLSNVIATDQFVAEWSKFRQAVTQTIAI